MKTPVFIRARVCTRIDDETVCTTREKKIVLAMVEDTKGTMLDGREVVKIDNWWYYIPPKGFILPQIDDSPSWVPPLQPPSPPEPPMTAPQPQTTAKPAPVEKEKVKPVVEKPKEKPKGFFKW